MNVEVSITKETSDQVAALLKAAAAALASIPPLPVGKDLLNSNIGGNFFEGEVSIPIGETQDLKAWINSVTAKFNAFAVAK